MAIVIKDMETAEEIKGKAYVHYKSWHEAYVGIVDKDYLDNFTLEKCEDIAFNFQNNIIIAKDDDKVIGFCGYGRYRNDNYNDVGEVYSIYVLSEYYGKGISHQLMEEALKRLEKYNKIVLWVLEDNARAIHFYRKCGFKIDGEKETFDLGFPARAIRMTLENKQTS